MNFKKHSLNIILGALVVAAIVLGYILIKGSGGKEKTPESETTAPAASLLEEEQKVLATPPPDASNEEKDRHFQLALKLATEAEALDVTGCQSKPVVMKTTQKGVRVKNNDAVDHEIVFDAEKRFKIPAEGSVNLTGLFDKGPGLYGYGCDSSPTATGLFFVTE